MVTPPTRARRSRYRRSRSAPLVIGAVLLVIVLAVGGIAGYRVFGFLRSVGNIGNPVQLFQNDLEPPTGSVAWKIKHGQRVNILALGYGGAENEAPWLTDSIMVVSLDPAGGRILEASIPRDLWVRIDGWQDDRRYSEKINAAFGVPKMFPQSQLKPRFQGRDGSGHLAEATVGRITGLTFDKYVAVDFAAFRDVVDALGKIQVHMDGPLDDCHYPDYHNGYVNHGVPPGRACPRGAGIHFAAGDYEVNGEQALQLARSRDAIQPEQANDFGRAKRQQMIMAAIRKKVTSTSAITRAPQLMNAIQSNYLSDMDLNDIKAVYDFAAKVPDGAIRGTCGPPAAFVLCPLDPSYRMWQAIFAHAFVDKKALAEQAPVQLVNASRSYPDMHDQATAVLREMGIRTTDGVRHSSIAGSVIYDYSGGRYPLTAAWLRDFFGAEVEPATPPTPGVRATFVPATGERTDGLVVVMGSDFASRWYGLS